MLSQKLRFEALEDRRVLAIDWVNEFGTGGDDPEFDDWFGAKEVYARQLVNRAIDEWESVINSFNYDNSSLNNTFELRVLAREIPSHLFCNC